MGIWRDIDRFFGDECRFVIKAFRYRRPLVCGANAKAHRIANLGHEFTRKATPAEETSR